MSGWNVLIARNYIVYLDPFFSVTKNVKTDAP
jgi:hypothetical protein